MKIDDHSISGSIDPRSSALHALACKAGNAWAQALFQKMRTEGRTVSGGWPGTTREGRTWMMAMADAMTRTDGVEWTFEEFDGAAEVTYAEARRAWLREAGHGAREGAQ
jgi:hypothetical protein